jgi:predicted CoA-substrate-specific enzyme activase
MQRFMGIDVGAETIKLAEVVRDNGALRVVRTQLAAHRKDPGAKLMELLGLWDWDRVESAGVTGRLGRRVALERIPTKEALLAGVRFVHGPDPVTLVSIGSRGFAVLEIRGSGSPVYRENSRCAQGTGNFLRQLVERFGLEVDEAARLAEGVDDPAPLSGRCPVILKTDLTHLANKGERKERLVAGLLDAIAENVEVLVKPRLSPPRVLLAGGVTQARRVREHFRRFLARHGMALVDEELEEAPFLEAIGCAVHAAERGTHPTPLERLIRPPPDASLEELPPLGDSMGKVTRMARSSHAAARVAPSGRGSGAVVAPLQPVILGFDIGSTGSKVIALDAAQGEPLWEGYLRTNGDPVGAAQALMKEFLAGPAGAHPVKALGATGSGREIVGSLLATCYGTESVFVLNEIAAHAHGALHHDPRVDTIFEIGGQDAKYIRLAEGRVVDAAMNEACSAGTGSFIEEQGRRFEGVEDVVQLGRVAMQAERGVALGQHCSVFMAEVIDEAVAAGVERGPIVAGIYASVVANYLNRVKGSRSVGQVVFCQGMPFTADALAAAVARQTGAEVIVPPSPGIVGALGIALLAAEAIGWEEAAPLEPQRFLGARLEKKDTFICNSTVGCGGGANKCRIDRLTTLVEGERQKFTWGGACSLYDKGTRKKKLPDLAPDPFREREDLIEALVARLSGDRGGQRIALTDEFQLKGLFPFFATFLHGLGLDLDVARGADRTALKRGIEGANVPFCAPMQQHHGLVQAMAERKPDLLFLPMVRSIPRTADEPYSKTCPVVGGCPDVLRADLGADLTARIISPVVDVDAGGLEGETFTRACRQLAADVGVRSGRAFQRAFAAAHAAQLDFDAKLLEIGRKALRRCEADGILPVVVLGRTYTIHNDVLNSNVPAILREQGAIAIPVDCYPVADDVPRFPNMYWAYGQRLLRAAWQIRRTPGIYSLFASNYSCGPDSFTLHFYQYLMEGKPFVVIETDGHSGDAGTKTRVEAFLHCVREDLRGSRPRAATDEARLTVKVSGMRDILVSGERVLLPRMGPATDIVAATLRGAGVETEALPEPTVDTLRIGRRHTSGKECLPASLTLGSLLERLERERGSDRRFVLFMPSAEGPCRFGVYKELHQLVLDRLGWSDRVRIWAPPSRNYFEGMQPGLKAVLFAGISASDRLRDMLYDIRPGESRPGAAEALFARWMGELEAAVEHTARSADLSASRVLVETLTGEVWGIPELVSRAAHEFAAVRGARELPAVLVAGEIYVRNVPFSNGTVVDALARRGIRAKIAGVTEFLQYSDWNAVQNGEHGLSDKLSSWVRRRIEIAVHDAAAGPLGWAPTPPTTALVAASSPYMRGALEGEAVLTIGAPVHAWRHREIDAAVSVGPLECMPNKLAESQFHHVSEREGLLSLTLSLNGDPIDPEILDAFAFEVHARFRARTEGASDAARPSGSWVDRLEQAIEVLPATEDSR